MPQDDLNSAREGHICINRKCCEIKQAMGVSFMFLITLQSRALFIQFISYQSAVRVHG